VAPNSLLCADGAVKNLLTHSPMTRRLSYPTSRQHWRG